VEKHHQNLRDSPVPLVGAFHKKVRLPSNKTHYGRRDPDGLISVKPGMARKPEYHCSMGVHAAEGVISHILADFANSKNSQYLTDIGTVRGRTSL